MNFSCFCKATDKESGCPKYSQNWVGAVQSKLIIDDETISCGKYSINLSDIKSAHLYKTKSFFYIPGKILEVKTKHKCYQFSIFPWVNVVKHLSINNSESSVKLKGYPFGSYSLKQQALFLCILIGLSFQFKT